MNKLKKSLVGCLMLFSMCMIGGCTTTNDDSTSDTNSASTSSTKSSSTKSSSTNADLTTLLNPAETYSQSGTGDKIITNLVANNKYTMIHLTHNGSRNFIVIADEDGQKLNYLANKIGAYDGYTILDEKGTFRLDIKADGDWTVEVVQFQKSETDSFSGTGDFVTDVFETKTDAWEYSHNGSRNIIIRQYTVNSYNLSVNKIGQYSGQSISNIKKGKGSFFVIQADGDWTITAL